MKITHLDVLMLFGAFQGVFLGFILPCISKVRKKSNTTLSYLLAMCSIMLLGRIMYFHFPKNWAYQITLIPDVIIYLFGPTLWLYIWQIVKGEKESPAKYHLHFLPAITHLLGVLYYFQFTNSEYLDLFYTGKLTLYFNTSEVSAIILNLAYLSVCFILIVRSKDSYGRAINKQFRMYLFTLLILFSTVILIWFIGFLYKKSWEQYFFYDYTWVTISIVSLFVGYYAISRPELFNKPNVRSKTGPLISEIETEVLSDRLYVLMNEQRLFTDSGLTLQYLALELGISKNKLSWLLNKVYNSNFYDYVNQFRIDEVLNKIKNEELKSKTILGIALESGFNSKTTFNKAFKTKVGTTPSVYLKQFSTPPLIDKM